jgi:tRNA pseudouridine38/39 synthase
LWKALNKARLIFPRDTSPVRPGEVNWDGCEYSKCGRTDKGVSAFGQVIGIRVRSNRPLARRKADEDEVKADMHNTYPRPGSLEVVAGPLGAVDDKPSHEDEKDAATSLLDDSDFNDALSFDYIKDEIPYPHVLNRVLPPDIRILAWCPSPPSDFSARFSCRERRYRYFFTQPAFPPMPGPMGLSEFVDVQGRRRREGWLDIQAMREGAKYFEGSHDFRNFCKVDPTKQLTSFERKIFYADVEEVDPRSGPMGFVGRPQTKPSASDSSSQIISEDGLLGYEDPPKVYAFTVHGSGFLWHQVRHMAAVLFLIGQGLELPSVIPALLDIERQPTKPHYEMADDAPLVLWDCIFPQSGDDSRKDALQWVYVDRTNGVESRCAPTTRDGKFGTGGLVENIWEIWRRKKMDEVLAGSLLDIIISQGNQDTQTSDTAGEDKAPDVANRHTGRGRSQKVFQGGNGPSLKGTWIPVLQKRRMDTVEAINARYATKKALESGTSREEREGGWRKVAIKRGDSTNGIDE